MGVVWIILMCHPVCMRFRHPARVAIVSEPTGNPLQAMREFMRSSPIILERTHANPHARAIFAVQVLHKVLTAIKSRHHGIVEHIDIALEFSVGAFRERQHPTERINVKGIHLFKRLKHAFGIGNRNRNVIYRAIIGFRLFANFKMFRRTNQRKAIAFALRNPVHISDCRHSRKANQLREESHSTTHQQP